MKRALRIIAWAVAAGGLAAVLVPVLWSDGMAFDDGKSTSSATAIPIAVLGDSNSHAYQDSVSFEQIGRAHV